MWDMIREIYQSLRTARLRTALTGFAVAWGIFMLIILLGLSRGLVNNFKEMSGRRPHDNISVWSGVTTKAYHGLNPGRQIYTDIYDVKALSAPGAGDHIRSATAFKNLQVPYISTSRDYLSLTLQGVEPSTAVNQDVRVVAGRFINAADMQGRRKSMVLSLDNARKLFEDPYSAIGSHVNAMGLAWTVVGLYEREWNTDDVFVPYTTANALAGGNKYVYNMKVRLKDVTDKAHAEAAEEEVRQVLARQHNFDPTDTGAMGMWNEFTNHLAMQGGMSILEIVVWVIGIFTLLTGIVGVGNIMFVSVRERTHEIGIRRAIGARPRHIIMQVITESILLTTVFGYVGVVAGMLLMQGLAAVDGIPGMSNPTVDIGIALRVTLVLIAAGALAGLFPAMKATKVKPVEALRDE